METILIPLQFLFDHSFLQVKNAATLPYKKTEEECCNKPLCAMQVFRISPRSSPHSENHWLDTLPDLFCIAFCVDPFLAGLLYSFSFSVFFFLRAIVLAFVKFVLIGFFNSFPGKKKSLAVLLSPTLLYRTLLYQENVIL